ncbi:uncharacterized protein SPSK_10492 [Sporothrix schenckii 1099-18]|uniref:Uncharacterized protein n=1 Tax=Sporothrix schenckii 1099-18 TaxID=1397361 RepID=A0A0F2MBI1_SPOSC|nr:uncharacterized protein SPSK_10492 [Sporothrix schenckii 1099-18]KJR86434.1 hypothetical protein SPSK_10492 [Sporothrix schenckii 1099-18]
MVREGAKQQQTTSTSVRLKWPEILFPTYSVLRISQLHLSIALEDGLDAGRLCLAESQKSTARRRTNTQATRRNIKADTEYVPSA